MSNLRRIGLNISLCSQGVPYRRTVDEVMWRCKQAGLLEKWIEELNPMYASQGNGARGEEPVDDDIDDDKVRAI